MLEVTKCFTLREPMHIEKTISNLAVGTLFSTC